MLDKSIDSALQALRRQMIREGQNGLCHVEALLRLRGIRLAKVPPPMPDDCLHYGAVRPIVLAALQGGADTTCQIADAVLAAMPGMDRQRALIRVYRAVYKLRDKGLVRQEGRLWGLAD